MSAPQTSIDCYFYMQSALTVFCMYISQQNSMPETRIASLKNLTFELLTAVYCFACTFLFALENVRKKSTNIFPILLIGSLVPQ